MHTSNAFKSATKAAILVLVTGLVVAIIIFIRFDKDEPRQFELVEYLAVKGRCDGDNAQKKFSVNYEGEIIHWYDAGADRHIRNGSVYRTFKEPVTGQDQPPMQVSFDGLSAAIISGDAFRLRGVRGVSIVDERQESRGFGREATCELEVIQRLDHFPPSRKGPFGMPLFTQ